VDAVEIGAKARVNGITWTAAAYDYDYTDIQVASFVTIDGAILQRLSNAAAAKMRGFEFTAEGNLSDNLSFSTGANWTPTAEFKDFTTAQITRPVPGAPGPILGEVVMPYDASGSRIPRTPKWTANARLTYSTELWGGYFSGTLSAFHSPGFYWQAGNLTPESSYNLVGTRLAWTNPSGRITYSIWGTNLTDSDHSVYTTPNIRGDSTAYAQGRQIGIGIAFDL
jgi:iron complex outermembrane receptor protein